MLSLRAKVTCNSLPHFSGKSFWRELKPESTQTQLLTPLELIGRGEGVQCFCCSVTKLWSDSFRRHELQHTTLINGAILIPSLSQIFPWKTCIERKAAGAGGGEGVGFKRFKKRGKKCLKRILRELSGGGIPLRSIPLPGGRAPGSRLRVGTVGKAFLWGWNVCLSSF